MQAKFVYEAIGDVLKPKSEEEILASIEDLSPDDLLYKSAEKGFLIGVKMALENGADIHAIGNYALRFASGSGYYDVVKLLLKHGADVHVFDDYALRFASLYGNYNIVALLLDKGAHVHANDDEPLRWASLNGHDDIIALLKKYM